MTTTTNAVTLREQFKRDAIPLIDFLYRFALRLAGDEAQAEDLVQDTMLKAFRAWHQFKPGSNAKAWLATILRNTFINERRRGTRQVSGLGEDLIERLQSAHGLESPDPETLFFHDFVDDEVLAAIDALPDEFKEALVLSDVEGLPYNEIARITRSPLGTVKSRIFRARQILQQKLYAYAVEMGYVGAAVT